MIRVGLPWPGDLKAICRADCAERGEPPCWEIDEAAEPHHAGHAMRGKVCDECYAAWREWRDGPEANGGEP